MLSGDQSIMYLLARYLLDDHPPLDQDVSFQIRNLCASSARICILFFFRRPTFQMLLSEQGISGRL